MINNLKMVALVLAIVAAVWFFKDYQHQKSENARQTENNAQLRRADSLRYTTQILTEREIGDYLEFQNSDLKKKLDQTGIKLSRIESIVSTNYKFKDDTLRSSDISNIVSAVRNNIPTSSPFVDSTKCMVLKGNVRYQNDSMVVDIVSREFKNKSDGVAYWERRQWKFLGIKTRLFGKKQFTAKTFDQCGESAILKIEKKK